MFDSKKNDYICSILKRLMMGNKDFGIEQLLRQVPFAGMLEELQFIRRYQSRLSDTNIDARTFKYLKKLGVFDSFLPADGKKWHQLNLTEQVLLKISETFWRYGYETVVIKSIVNGLLSDSWLFAYINDILLADNTKVTKVNDDRASSFIEYSILEKMSKPNLRSFTNLDALIIAAFTLEKPVSIIVNGKGRWGVFSGVQNKTSKEVDILESVFSESFVNITIKGIVDSILIQQANKSPIINPNVATRKQIESLISKGFGYKEVMDIEFGNDDLETKLIDLPVTANLGKAKNDYANQNLLVKVRDSKVSSVKQLVIKNLKK